LRDDGQLRLRDCDEKDHPAKAVLGVSSGGGQGSRSPRHAGDPCLCRRVNWGWLRRARNARWV